MIRVMIALKAPSVVVPSDLTAPRYEVLPFAKAEAQAAEAGTPLRLTVTTSPKHGIDRSLEVAEHLRGLGHAVTLHLAARMVRSEQHLEAILDRAARAGIDDFLVIGGDAPEPLGPFAAAAPVLELVDRHALRPDRLGIGAYPEGHPLIRAADLEAALARKAEVADYLVTQLCFDSTMLFSWLERLRAGGIAQPVYVGAAGPVERRRLLEISTRIGVGPSLRFLRKQRGLTTLFRSPVGTATRFYDRTAAAVDRGDLGVAGFHFFTFNDLLGTRRWHEGRQARRRR
jgi:methylenetetrahydrofolate reductase (NADPH)